MEFSIHRKEMEKCEIHLRRESKSELKERDDVLRLILNLSLFEHRWLKIGWKVLPLWQHYDDEYFSIQLHRPRFIFIGACQR